MMGKPMFSDDVDQPDGRKGSASGTPGLTRLDVERGASLADEGGVSGAAVESQNLETLKKLASELATAHLRLPERDSPGGKPPRLTIKVAIAIAMAWVGLMAYRRWS